MVHSDEAEKPRIRNKLIGAIPKPASAGLSSVPGKLEVCTPT